ncbi:TPA: EexN family lipoprotein [Vibrio parahaemolyticus]
MKKLPILCFFSLILLGCSQEEVKTVEWYQENEQERLELLKECENNAAKADSINCRNAVSANAKESTKNLLKRP